MKRIQMMLEILLTCIQGALRLTNLVLDEHFGNHFASYMICQCQLNSISKLRHDSSVFFPYSGLALN